MPRLPTWNETRLFLITGTSLAMLFILADTELLPKRIFFEVLHVGCLLRWYHRLSENPDA